MVEELMVWLLGPTVSMFVGIAGVTVALIYASARIAFWLSDDE